MAGIFITLYHSVRDADWAQNETFKAPATLEIFGFQKNRRFPPSAYGGGEARPPFGRDG